MASDVGPQSSIAIAVKRVQEPIASTHTSGPGHQHETVLIVAPETNISWPPNGTDGITIGTVDIDDLRMRNHCVAADLQQRSGREAGSPDITALSRHQGEPGVSARYAHRYNIAMAETIDSLIAAKPKIAFAILQGGNQQIRTESVCLRKHLDPGSRFGLFGVADPAQAVTHGGDPQPAISVERDGLRPHPDFFVLADTAAACQRERPHRARCLGDPVASRCVLSDLSGIIQSLARIAEDLLAARQEQQLLDSGGPQRARPIDAQHPRALAFRKALHHADRLPAFALADSQTTRGAGPDSPVMILCESEHDIGWELIFARIHLQGLVSETGHCAIAKADPEIALSGRQQRGDIGRRQLRAANAVVAFEGHAIEAEQAGCSTDPQVAITGLGKRTYLTRRAIARSPGGMMQLREVALAVERMRI
ncbi:hypothetical protein XEUV354_22470 [Xanthomonas euvesicatoria]|nr:hypothetical protein XEUV354_22470 [Xanthomonas euvesicatoria]KLB54691.1 hypothetical protein XEUV376_19280 [Xanthomonas euvesicatoria]KLB63767.1 hypothetical protein XEUV490_22270 [Xanthomonas euvesicatoria]KLB79319.1 hypothetical protein XEUV526_22255 [Xanthomonas euvesicatoria]